MNVRPEVHSTILETLQRMGGKALEQNLLEELRARGLELRPEALRQALLKLEMHEKVRVISLDAERKLIELTGV
ncbi:MAG: hypothetical protein B9J98_06935 [Candidatus Terraquivivens tikiterensis]|uniref:Uncharacterized protein n=1 Tax=Candidatus Terraquivivens tikiterensis TaxID=1980982 RepID=A0A2R7Y1D2_9ARCH|nr:MAG: hypothetical protein B9J98_06935 [Candidatus Terraquivivens tikiterensis]